MTRALAAGCIAAAALAAPGIAAAKTPKPKPLKTAVFQGTVSGSQVTQWKYHRAYDDANPCVPEASGYGDQQITFTGKPFKVTFTMPPKSDPNLFGTRGRPAVSMEPGDYRVSAEASRDTDYTYGQPGAGCDAENGGGVDPDEQPPKDCGERRGSFALRLAYYVHTPLEDAIPGGAKHLRNQIRLDTSDPSYFGSSHGGLLENAYTNCELSQQSWVERQGVIYRNPARLAEKQLFNKKRKRFLVSGDTRAPIEGDGYTGDTLLAWNLKLKRVK
jgi:hypothetical protein